MRQPIQDPVIVVLMGYFINEQEPPQELVRPDGTPIPSRQFKDWEKVFWMGDGLPGRLPQALREAYTQGAHRLVVAVGNAVLKNSGGATEAEWFRKYLYGVRDNLKRDFPRLFAGSVFADPVSYREWLDSLAIFEGESTNTATAFAAIEWSLRMALQELDAERIRLHVVTSANHVGRTMTDMMAYLEKVGLHHYVTPVAVGAWTCYGHRNIKDVKVFDLGLTEKQLEAMKTAAS